SLLPVECDVRQLLLSVFLDVVRVLGSILRHVEAPAIALLRFQRCCDSCRVQYTDNLPAIASGKTLSFCQERVLVHGAGTPSRASTIRLVPLRRTGTGLCRQYRSFSVASRFTFNDAPP